MSAPRYAVIAAKLLGRREAAVAAPSTESRARAIARLELALSRKAERRRGRQVWFGALAVAAAIAAVSWAYARRSTSSARTVAAIPITAMLKAAGIGARLLTLHGVESARVGSLLPVGARLVTGEGGASLRLSTGTEISLQEGASLAFSGGGAIEQFELSAGSLRAHVAKLGAAQRFIVRTPDAEVEVRGTLFRVSVVEPDASCGAGTQTRVRVTEGVVEVRSADSATRVYPGQVWPRNCAVPAATPVGSLETSAIGRTLQANPHGARRGVTRASNLATVPQSVVTAEDSSLAQQNDLFAAAVAARRNGDNSGALSKLREFNARFPKSALSESVSAERLRALLPIDHAEAEVEARKYLAKYPQGFAQREAEATLAAP